MSVAANSETEILATLSGILQDLLGDEAIHLTMQTERQDVPGWDSLAYVNFIVATEMAFGIRFKLADVESFPDVGASVRAIGAMRPPGGAPGAAPAR